MPISLHDRYPAREPAAADVGQACQLGARSGTASKATVSRGCGLWKGMVPCQKYDGKSTSMPGVGRTEYSASSDGVVRILGLPKLSTPSSVLASAMKLVAYYLE